MRVKVQSRAGLGWETPDSACDPRVPILVNQTENGTNLVLLPVS